MALLAVMTEQGQQNALREWAKLKPPFTPGLPAPPVPQVLPVEMGGVLADFTVLDLEFTPPAELLELAAVRYVNWQEVGRYTSLVHYTGPIHPKVTEVTGLTLMKLRNAPTELEVLQRFFALAGDSVLVAHNAVSADQRVLEAARRRHGKTEKLPNLWHCTYALAKRRMPKDTKCGLGELCNTLGIATHGAHRAERDVEMCYQVLRHFHHQQPITELITSTAKPKAAGTGQLFPATV